MSLSAGTICFLLVEHFSVMFGIVPVMMSSPTSLASRVSMLVVDPAYFCVLFHCGDVKSFPGENSRDRSQYVDIMLVEATGELAEYWLGGKIPVWKHWCRQSPLLTMTLWSDKVTHNTSQPMLLEGENGLCGNGRTQTSARGWKRKEKRQILSDSILCGTVASCELRMSIESRRLTKVVVAFLNEVNRLMEHLSERYLRNLPRKDCMDGARAQPMPWRLPEEEGNRRIAGQQEKKPTKPEHSVYGHTQRECDIPPSLRREHVRFALGGMYLHGSTV